MSKYSNADVTVAINLLTQCPGNGMGNMIVDLLNELLQRRGKENTDYAHGFVDGCEYVLANGEK